MFAPVVTISRVVSSALGFPLLINHPVYATRLEQRGTGKFGPGVSRLIPSTPHICEPRRCNQPLSIN